MDQVHLEVAVILQGTPEQIMAEIVKDHPEVGTILPMARAAVGGIKGSLREREYQAACLYALAGQYNAAGARILEIGTLVGYSAFVMAMAAPEADILTLNPNDREAEAAMRTLRRFSRVTVCSLTSLDLLDYYEGPALDMVFVDGDHKRAWDDVPWWNHLKPGGLMLWHDYTPQEVRLKRESVYCVVNEWAERLGRPLDVRVVDDEGVGMAGMYRREGETWQA